MRDCYKLRFNLLQEIVGLMVKIRKLASLEKGLEEIIKVLSEFKFHNILNKSFYDINK